MFANLHMIARFQNLSQRRCGHLHRDEALQAQEEEDEHQGVVPPGDGRGANRAHCARDVSGSLTARAVFTLNWLCSLTNDTNVYLRC
jgi:hypothetical protein